ncbi:large ribosomal subunit protein bL21m [Ahaetulla prasina]|uniref:large ribosomal subunit protein bL21m n=1 Tax=Ahaetulla prasina TaxID=499056 RepID=UPI002649BE41|nr:large ribosomal subunit protein bL21m [Ahaetulla prasina]
MGIEKEIESVSFPSYLPASSSSHREKSSAIGSLSEIVQNVNELIATGQYGRLFAVVHFASRQWKITSEDLILIENHIPAECGDRIRMEKVLLVGADNFTLLGKPLLGKDLVRVEATVIEKTESWPRVNVKFRRRKSYETRKIVIQPQTVLRINSIEIAPVLS